MWTFVISIDLLFDKLYGYFHTAIIVYLPVCHNEDFQMHNDIHHITNSMMNNYIVIQLPVRRHNVFSVILIVISMAEWTYYLVNSKDDFIITEKSNSYTKDFEMRNEIHYE